MAEFSKEYGEKTNLGFNDFSIKEIFNSLDEGYMVSQICEGFGFYTISKINNKCNVLVDYGDTTIWKVFDFSTNTID